MTQTPSRIGEVVLATEDLRKHYPLTQGIVFKKQVGAVRAVDGVNIACDWSRIYRSSSCIAARPSVSWVSRGAASRRWLVSSSASRRPPRARSC